MSTYAESQTVNVIPLAEKIAAHLDGRWSLDANTKRALSESDTWTRHYAALVSAVYGMAELSLSIHYGRLHASLNYPKDWEPYIDGRGRVYRESITVALRKTPEQIGKDITRRLFEGTDYFPQLKTIRERKQAYEDKTRQDEMRAAIIRQILGVPTPDWVGMDKRGLSHLTKDKARVDVYLTLDGQHREGAIGFEADCRSGYTVKVEHLTEAELAAVAGFVAGLRA